jgi:hypothetical protein
MELNQSRPYGPCDVTVRRWRGRGRDNRNRRNHQRQKERKEKPHRNSLRAGAAVARRWRQQRTSYMREVLGDELPSGLNDIRFENEVQSPRANRQGSAVLVTVLSPERAGLARPPRARGAAHRVTVRAQGRCREKSRPGQRLFCVCLFCAVLCTELLPVDVYVAVNRQVGHPVNMPSPGALVSAGANRRTGRRETQCLAKLG